MALYDDNFQCTAGIDKDIALALFKPPENCFAIFKIIIK